MEELSRKEIFAMFKIDIEKIELMADNDDELESLLNFVEQGLRNVAELIDESPSFLNLWEIKSKVLPYSKTAGEIESKNDKEEGNLYKTFTNQLTSDVTFVVWLALSSSIVVGRYLATTQAMFGDKMKLGEDKQWFMEKMTRYYEDILRPQFENITDFMLSIDWTNEEDDSQVDNATRLTEGLWDNELKDSLLNLTPVYLQAMETVFQKITGLYIEAFVFGEEGLNE
jgi:hypothetical protein